VDPVKNEYMSRERADYPVLFTQAVLVSEYPEVLIWLCSQDSADGPGLSFTLQDVSLVFGFRLIADPGSPRLGSS
jgi:hypothetical protein